MFSKAKIKRFNEENIGCGPPPTKYDPRFPEAHVGGYLERSNRWKNEKEVTPAPNAYNAFCLPFDSTPRKKVRSGSSSCLNSTTSSNASHNSLRGGFMSPAQPCFTRSKSFRSVKCKESQSAELKEQMKALKDEKISLEQSVRHLEKELSELKLRKNDDQSTSESDSLTTKRLCDSGTQVDIESEQDSSPEVDINDSLQPEDLSCKKPRQEVNISPDELMLLKEQIEHLTILRDNLEASVASKEEAIADLQMQIDLVVIEAEESHEEMEIYKLEVEKFKNELEKTFDEKRNVDSYVKDIIAKYEALKEQHQLVHIVTKDIIAQKDIEIELLNDSISTLNTKVSEYERTVCRIQSEISLKRSQISSLEITVGDLSIATKEKEVMETMLEDEIEEKNKEMTKMEKSLEDVETKLKEIMKEREELITALDKEKARSEDLSVQLKNLEMSLKEQGVVQQFLEKEVVSREAEVKLKASSTTIDKADNTEKTYQELLEEDKLKTAKIESLEENITKLTLAMKHKEENANELKDRIAKLRAELTDRGALNKKRLIEKEAEIEELSVKYSDALLDQESTKRILNATFDKLENEKLLLQATERELESVRNELATKKLEIAHLEVSVRELTHKLIHVEDALVCEEAAARDYEEETDRKLDSFSEKFKKFVNEKQALQSSNEGFMAQITQLRIDMTKKSVAVEDMQRRIDDLREEKSLLNTSCATLQAVLEEKETLLVDLQNEFEGTLKTITDLQLKLEEAEISTSIFKAEIEERKVREETLVKEFDEEKCSLVNQISLLENHLREEEEDRVNFKEKVLELEGRCNEIQEEKSEVIEKLQIQIKAEKKKTNGLETQLTKYECYEDTLNNMQTSLLNKTAEVAKLEKSFLEANLTMDSYHGKVDDLQSTISNLIQESEELKCRLESKDDLMTAMNESLSLKNSQIEDLQKALEAKNQQLLSYENLIKSTGLAIESFEKEKRKATSELVLLRNLLDGTKEELSKMKENYEKEIELQVSNLVSTHQIDKEILQGVNLALQEEVDMWKQKFLYLEKMIEPFREQLDAYELEKTALLSQSSAAQEEVHKLSDEYAKLLGHNNHKQKIQHVVKLKCENNQLRERVQKLLSEVEKHKKTIKRFEERSVGQGLKGRAFEGSKTQLFDKENKENTSALAANTSDFPQVTSTPLRSSNKYRRV